jgi:hypothetical protein
MSGLVMRCNVSGFDRSRIHQDWLYANETRRLVTNFNGAIDPESLIQSARWDTWQNFAGLMSEPAISDDRKAVSVKVASQYSGTCIIKCTITTVEGEVLTQNHVLNVKPAPYYQNQNYTNGPTTISVEYVEPVIS